MYCASILVVIAIRSIFCTSLWHMFLAFILCFTVYLSTLVVRMCCVVQKPLEADEANLASLNNQHQQVVAVAAAKSQVQLPYYTV